MNTSDPDTKAIVLITGASGLIGGRISRQLAPDYVVIGLDVKPPQHECLDGFYSTDLTDEQSVEQSLQEVKEEYGNRIASVIHLAAYYDFSGEPSPLYQELTVQGTRRLLRTLRNQEFEVQQFVFSSSLLVMKPHEGSHISEFSEVQAEWAYPQSKLEAEAAIREEHGEIPYVILRIAGVYDEECHSLPVSQQMTRIYEKQLESYFFPGDDDHGQALVHLDDLADCFRKVVEHRRTLDPASLFLIAEPDVMSYEELQDRIGEDLHGKEWPTIRIPKVMAKAGAFVKEKLSTEDSKPFIKPWMVDLADANYAVTIAHARSQLDWDPQHRLRDTLPQMTEFLKRDPRQFYEVNNLPLPAEIEAATS